MAWTTEGKDPPYVSAGGELLSAALLYAFRKLGKSETGAEWEISCVVITRTAVDPAGEVHDRMPVFLTPDVSADWLTPEDLTDKVGTLADAQALIHRDRDNVGVVGRRPQGQQCAIGRPAKCVDYRARRRLVTRDRWTWSTRR